MIRIIDFEEARKAFKNTQPEEWLSWVDSALRSKADFVMPPKPRMSQEQGDYYNVMPAMYEAENTAIVKMIGRHGLKEGENRSVMLGDMMIYEADTGILKGIADAEYITTLRTGTVAAHSALMFARDNWSTLGLIGLGNIMTVCFEALIAGLRSKGDNRVISVRLLRHNGQELRFKERFGEFENISFELCDSYEQVIDGSDVVISAVTRATENFAEDKCFKQGVTVIPVCTMGFQNCDLFFDKVFTDEIEQIRGFKYFDKFRSVANVSDVLNGIKIGRESNSERILVYNYGIGIHDLVFANRLLSLTQGKETEYSYCKEKYFV